MGFGGSGFCWGFMGFLKGVEFRKGVLQALLRSSVGGCTGYYTIFVQPFPGPLRLYQVSCSLRRLHCSTGLQACYIFLPTLRLLRGSWAVWGRVAALGARVRDLTTRVQEP